MSMKTFEDFKGEPDPLKAYIKWVRQDSAETFGGLPASVTRELTDRLMNLITDVRLYTLFQQGVCETPEGEPYRTLMEKHREDKLLEIMQQVALSVHSVGQLEYALMQMEAETEVGHHRRQAFADALAAKHREHTI